jgi:hypothetical protein
MEVRACWALWERMEPYTVLGTVSPIVVVGLFGRNLRNKSGKVYSYSDGLHNGVSRSVFAMWEVFEITSRKSKAIPVTGRGDRGL